MSKDIDPRFVNYPGNSEYGYGPDGYKYNRQGGMTAASKAEKARKEWQRSQRARQEEARRSAPAPKMSDYSGGSYSGPSLFGALFASLGLAAPFVVTGLIVIMMAGFAKMLEPWLYFARLIWNVLKHVFTAWPEVFARRKEIGFIFHVFRSFGNYWVYPLEILLAIGTIGYTVRKFVNSDTNAWLRDTPYGVAFCGFVILEVLHHFTANSIYGYGLIMSIWNGICLSLPVLIIMFGITEIGDKIKRKE